MGGYQRRNFHVVRLHPVVAFGGVQQGKDRIGVVQHLAAAVQCLDDVSERRGFGVFYDRVDLRFVQADTRLDRRFEMLGFDLVERGYAERSTPRFEQRIALSLFAFAAA